MGSRAAREIFEFDSLADFIAAGGADAYGVGMVRIGAMVYECDGVGISQINTTTSPEILGMNLNNHDSDVAGGKFLDASGWAVWANGSGSPVFENSPLNTKFSTQTLKIGNVAGANTVNSKYRSLPVNYDLTNVDGFTFWVYCDGPTAVSGIAQPNSEIMIAIGDLGVANASYCNVFGAAGGTWRRGWNNVRLSKADFATALSGTGVNWASVRDIHLRFWPKSNYTGNAMYFDSMFIGGFAQNRKAPVVITFDDSTEDSVLLTKIANSFGIPVTQFVMPDYVDNHTLRTTYQTIEQVREMYQAGNAICGHYDQVNGFIVNPGAMATTRTWLINNGFTRDDCHNYLSWPNGSTNEATIDAAISMGIKGARGVVGTVRNDASSIEEGVSSVLVEPVACGGIANPFKINSLSGAEAGTSANALAAVDKAIEKQAGVTFYYHTLAEISQVQFTAFCAGLKTRMAAGTVECLTFPQFCQRYTQN